MIDLCRLCLTVRPDCARNLYDNSELMLKISSCLQVDILKDESLPNQVCHICNNMLDQMLTYIKSVIKNQNILYHHLKLGKNCLEKFYSLLIDGKEIKDEELVIKMESDDNIDDKKEIAVDIKIEEPVVENNDFYSDDDDDDNIPIISLKNKKRPEKWQDDVKSMNDLNFTDDSTTIISLQNKEKLDCVKEITVQNRTKKKILKEHPTECKENMTNTISNTNKLAEYKCLTCFKIFDTSSILTKHYRNVHTPTPSPSIEKINYIEIDGDEKKYKCEKCEKICHSKKKARRHINYKHQENRPYICNLCGRTFKLPSEIIKHLRAHSGSRLFCSFGCGYNTAYQGGLRTHERKHRDLYKYKCEECGKGFEVKSWFEDHRNVHTGAKPFVCHCGQAYHCKRYLVRHQTTAHPSLPASTATRYMCTHCAFPCHTKIALQTHLSKEHGIKLSFLCDECGKSFKRSTHLLTHKQTHLGVKSFTCSGCPSVFSSLSSLRRHARAHLAPRPHPCPHCHKRFTRLTYLHKHTRRQHSMVVHKTD